MSLQKALEVREDLISRPGMGVNSPLVRRLDEIIKTAYGMPGRDAIKQARISSSRVPGSSINALIKREVSPPEPRTRSGKETGQAKLQRLAERQGEQAQVKLTKREERNQLRGVMQDLPIQRFTPESEEGGNVVEDKPQAQGSDPITPNEAMDLVKMSPKEIIETYGLARVDVTLQQMGEELKGSDRQRAARLKKIIAE